MLIFRKGTETDPHWNDNAELVWSVLTYYVAACETDPARRNLLAVRAITRSRDAYLAVAQHHAAARRHAEGAGRFALDWLQDKELKFGPLHARRQTAWMDSPQVAACLQRSTSIRSICGAASSMFT